MPELSPLTQRLIKDFSRSKKTSAKTEDDSLIEIKVSKSQTNTFYKKLKKVINWKEEQFLKRSSIEKILKNSSAKTSSTDLISDLFCLGYFEKKKIRKKDAEDIQTAIERHAYLLEKFQNKNISNWLLSITSCEIEDILSKSEKEKSLIFYMFHSLKDSLRTEENIEEEKKNTLLYIAVQQSLFNLDSSAVTYNVLKFRNDHWKNLSKENFEKIAENIEEEKREIESLLNSPLLKKFYQFCKKQNTSYLIIKSILEKNIDNAREVFSDPQEIEKITKNDYEEKLIQAKETLSRSLLYGVIFVFLLKAATLFIIEIPFASFFSTGKFTAPLIIINILVPTFLTSLLVLILKNPPEKNKKRVVLEIIRTIYKKEREEFYTIRKRKYSSTLYYIIVAFYFLIFFFSASLILWILGFINFPFLSSFIFIIFISLIAFFNVKINEKLNDFKMIELREGIIDVVIDIFAFPVLQIEKLLKKRCKKYTALSIFFSTLFNTPFKFFFEIFEQWKNYLKEKKEEIY